MKPTSLPSLLLTLILLTCSLVAQENLDDYFMKTNPPNENLFQDQSFRRIININDNWLYLEDNQSSPAGLSQSKVEWRKINLPHTWNAFDPTDAEPGYRRDASWYEKSLYVPALNEGTVLKLYFEGINIKSEVYVNGQKAGGHIGGYLGFDVDITPFVKENQTNIILVRADNSYNSEVVPSQKADYFIFGGISRDVWLKVLPSAYVNGMHISTPQVSETSASTHVKVWLENNSGNKNLSISASLKDKTGKEIASVTKKLKTSNEIEFDFKKLKNPNLWSPDDPYLYTVEINLKEGNKVIDTYSDRCGYRWFEFKDHGPFYLNGKRLVIRGTHRHEEHAGLGNALPNSQHRKDMEMIKDMGANFVRLAHYPQDPEVYKACDELGLLVWDENPWCRGGVGNEEWKENDKRIFSEMIDQNYNHTSIIIWSLGNEIYWLPDFPGGGDVDSIRAFLTELNDLAHTKDPYRLTATRKFYEGSDIVDVFSPSIWAGWYSGVYKGYENAIHDSQEKYPKFLHVEYGGSSLPGRHSEQPITGDGLLNPDEWEENVNQVKIQNIANIGDWSENYVVDLFDWHLRYTELSKDFTGNVQWAFKDFGTPLRPENAIPYMNQKGLVDRAGNPKDAYYVFKSYWNQKDKFCYIESHTWTDRSGPEDLAREVCVYSNCEEVELFVNGAGQGKREKDINKFPASGLNWEINFASGKNTLEAVGYVNGKEAARDTIVVNYSFIKNGVPQDIALSYEKIENGNLLITALAVDENGQQCLDYNKRIYFSSDGSGHLFENYGTVTRSSIIEMANGKAQIEFKPEPGKKAVIEARNQDFKGSYLVIE